GDDEQRRDHHDQRVGEAGQRLLRRQHAAEDQRDHDQQRDEVEPHHVGDEQDERSDEDGEDGDEVAGHRLRLRPRRGRPQGQGALGRGASPWRGSEAGRPGRSSVWAPVATDRGGRPPLSAPGPEGTMLVMESTIAVAQMDCVVGDVDANLAKISDLVAEAKRQGAGLVIFPELATTGYFIADSIAELAEPVPGRTTDALAAIAARHDVWLVVGMAEAVGDRYYNVSVLVSPNGLEGTYRKVHLFDTEKATFAVGDEQAVFSTPFGK